MDIKKQAIKEKAIRELEKRYKSQREDLVEFIAEYFKKETPKGISELLLDDYIYIIADHLQKVIEGKITRLIINIPPWHTKTELVTKNFPVWALWNNPNLQVIATWYSTQLTQWFSLEAKEIYESQTFKRIFPRAPKLSDTQNTKEHWKTEAGGSYYATGTSGTITGKRTNLFLIDDPLKPDEADSDVKRIWVNNWFENTVASRLFNPLKDAIVVIAQRTHEDDLPWHLISKMNEWSGEEWTVLSLPAIAEEDEKFETRYWTFTRKEWEALAPSRFPLEALKSLKQSYWTVNFNCQYQQNPISEENQEFFREWFKYYHELPTGWRTFTTVDPAFSKKDTADDSAITTVKFVWDKVYVLEQTAGKFNPAELEDVIIHHVKKWKPEKVWVEAFQAQTTISFSLRNRLYTEKLHYTTVEEIKQTWDKLAKIRSLVPLYRNGLIYHNQSLEKLEDQLLKFPRWRHDDCPDSLQMALYLYELMPNTNKAYKAPKVKYVNWMPVVIK